MVQISIPGVPDSGLIDARSWANAMRSAMAGKTNNVGIVTGLDLSTLPLTITDARVGINSFVDICPANDHGEFVRVQSIANGSFVVNATQLAPLPGGPTSANFRYVIIG